MVRTQSRAKRCAAHHLSNNVEKFKASSVVRTQLLHQLPPDARPGMAQPTTLVQKRVANEIQLCRLGRRQSPRRVHQGNRQWGHGRSRRQAQSHLSLTKTVVICTGLAMIAQPIPLEWLRECDVNNKRMAWKLFHVKRSAVCQARFRLNGVSLNAATCMLRVSSVLQHSGRQLEVSVARRPRMVWMQPSAKRSAAHHPSNNAVKCSA